MSIIPNPMYQPYTVPARPSKAKQMFLIGLGVAFGTLSAILVGVLFSLILLHRSDTIMPHVEVAGIDVGGRATTEAAAILQQQWQQQAISLMANDTVISLSPNQLGLTLDIEATVQAAYRQGRSPIMLHEWLKAGGKAHVTPVWRFDAEVATVNLQAFGGQFYTPPVDASIRMRGPHMEMMPPVMGQAVNQEATLAYLRQNMASVLESKQLPLIMVDVPPTVTDLSGAVGEANRLINHTLTLNLYDPIQDEHLTWQLGSAEWAQWLNFTVENYNQPGLQWDLDTAALADYITNQQASLGETRYLDVSSVTEKIGSAFVNQENNLTLRIYHREQSYEVQYGDTFSSIAYKVGIPYPWIQQANPGVSDNLTAGQRLTIPSSDVMLPLSIVPDKRIVVSISEQTMRVYEQGQEKWVWSASTGINSSPTAPGIFQIQTHHEEAYAENWDLWMPYFMGVYRPVPFSDFMNGIHGFPKRGGWQLLWTDDLGHPVTYGCILIDSENAAQLFEWADEGVIVEIKG